MAIFNLFSRRQKELRGEIPDVYVYDKLSTEFRVQVLHIVDDAFGRNEWISDLDVDEAYTLIHNMLCREYGLFKLLPNSHSTVPKALLWGFIQQEKDHERVLDAIELLFGYIERVIGSDDRYSHRVKVSISPGEAILELNERFKQNGIGYQFEAGRIIRIDSLYTHSEIIKPTIALLNNPKFSGANQEYLSAHEHYRHGRNKECLNDCLKAFESTLKAICNEKGWLYTPTDTARKLIQICFQNNLVPSFTQNQFTSLQNALESGIPTIRNKLGGHGQGAVPQKVDDDITRYALNLTGTNIIFLIKQSGIV